MRIIAGTWRSRKLDRPAGDETRPVPDRVKEAIFSILGSYYDHPGGLPPLNVADVFAGSGSMGLEALSRGAARCDFLERAPTALAVLKRNIRALDAEASTRVVAGDAWRAMVATTDESRYDLVLLDPPYRDSQDTSADGKINLLLDGLAANRRGEAIVVLHHRAGVRFPPEACRPWTILDERKMGSNGVTIFKS